MTTTTAKRVKDMTITVLTGAWLIVVVVVTSHWDLGSRIAGLFVALVIFLVPVGGYVALLQRAELRRSRVDGLGKHARPHKQLPFSRR